VVAGGPHQVGWWPGRAAQPPQRNSPKMRREQPDRATVLREQPVPRSPLLGVTTDPASDIRRGKEPAGPAEQLTKPGGLDKQALASGQRADRNTQLTRQRIHGEALLFKPEIGVVVQQHESTRR